MAFGPVTSAYCCFLHNQKFDLSHDLWSAGRAGGYNGRYLELSPEWSECGWGTRIRT